MYTKATINSADKVEIHENHLSQKVEFWMDDDVTVITKEFNFSVTNPLKPQVMKYMEALNFADTIQSGEIDLTPEPIPEPKIPTKEEEDKTIFFEKYATLNSMKKALTEKLIEADNAELLALESEVKTLWKPEYFNKTPVDVVNS